MIFETKEDRENELRVMQKFLVSLHPNAFEAVKLPQYELDFMLVTEGNIVAFVEIKKYNKTYEDSSFVLISMKNKFPKLKKYNDFKPTYFIVEFACGKIIYSQFDKLKGEIKMGGRKPREGSSNDVEQIMYVNKEIFKSVG